MNDLSNELIVLPPEVIKSQSTRILERYHFQATEARKRYEMHYQELLNRWDDKDKGIKILKSFSFIGAITLSGSELEGMAESPLKKFVDAPSLHYENRYRYRMSYGKETDLRGEAYYQLFDRKQSPEERINMSIESLGDLVKRLPQIQEYVLTTEKLSTSELKVYLGYLDHLKIELLRFFHAQTHLRAGNKFVQKENQPEQNITEQSLASVTEAYYSILDGKSIQKINIEQDKLLSECEAVNLEIAKKRAGGESLDGIMRGLPEGDNPLFNKIYAIGLVKRLKEKGLGNLILAGMHFGGIELPWVIFQEIKYANLEKPEILTVHYSRYTNKKEPQQDFWRIVDHLVDTQKNILFLDDGVYSGSSLKAVMDLAKEVGFKNIEVSVALLANSRQLGRMLNTGGINPDFVDKMLIDAIGVSPFFRTKTSEDYLERKSKGLFNIVAERVRKMITENYPRTLAISKDIFANVRK